MFRDASGSPLEVIVAFTALANAALFAVQHVPAFPLDGGRIARAFVGSDRQPPPGDEFAAYLGQGFAGLMMGYGVFGPPGRRPHHWGLWYIVLGWMLGGAARAAIAQSTFERLEGITAGDIMDSEPVRSRPRLPVERAYDEFFLRYQGWPWFAVVEDDDRSRVSPTAPPSSTPR